MSISRASRAIKHRLTKSEHDLGSAKGTIRAVSHGGFMQVFRRGRIYWHQNTGAHEVHGGILQDYLAHGAEAAAPNRRREMGFPIADELKDVDGTPYSLFEFGGITWARGKGAVRTTGKKYQRFLKTLGRKRPPLAHTYLGQHPTHRKTSWSESLQGVTHSADHWFFTQTKSIHKFHVSADLDSSKAKTSRSMPPNLKRMKFNHFGDPDHVVWKGVGYLIVPVEGDGRDPIIAVFRDDARLTFIGFSLLPLQNKQKGSDRAGWCAVEPKTMLLHSSSNEISRRKPIFRYRVNFDTLSRGRVELSAHSSVIPTKTASRKGSISLEAQVAVDQRGRFSEPKAEAVEIAKYVQGGAFSPEGYLYINSGRINISKRDSSKNQGIFVFDQDYHLIDRSSTKRKPFKYEFHNGFPKYEEPEGITFWDIESVRQQSSAHAKSRGQLHVILLDPEPGSDEFYLKHYRVDRC